MLVKLRFGDAGELVKHWLGIQVLLQGLHRRKCQQPAVVDVLLKYFLCFSIIVNVAVIGEFLNVRRKFLGCEGGVRLNRG